MTYIPVGPLSGGFYIWHIDSIDSYNLHDLREREDTKYQPGSKLFILEDFWQ